MEQLLETYIDFKIQLCICENACCPFKNTKTVIFTAKKGHCPFMTLKTIKRIVVSKTRSLISPPMAVLDL